MRKFFVLLLLPIAFTAAAQTDKPVKQAKPFKVTVGIGYAAPADQSGNKSQSKAGLVYTIEPQYEIIRNLDLGFRIQQAFIQRPEYIDNTYYNQGNAKYTLSGAATVNYTFTVSSVLRPYIGGGVGLYYVEPSSPTYKIGNTVANYPLPATTNIGGLARIGVKFGIAHLEADYNFIGDTSVKNTSTGLTLTAANSYYDLTIGLTFGGSH